MMRIPGFGAEASLGSIRFFAMKQLSHIDTSRVVPQLPVGETGSGFCARKANECTYNCPPGDSACRDECDRLFWCCMTGCGAAFNPVGGIRQ